MTFSREELSAYLDGDLPAARAELLAAALATEPTLRGELEAMRSLRRQAADLAATATTPARDLWPGIAARVGSDARAGRRRPWWLAAALLLAALLGFATGFAAAAPHREATAGGARFLLLLREDAAMLQPTSAAEQTARIARYRAWAEDLRRRGALELGDKLYDGEGFVLRSDGDRERTGTVGVAGLFILRAADYEAARALARTCPHLQLGGTIELRRIFDT
jgi:hypothetical protein